jgi:hypothetical protein
VQLNILVCRGEDLQFTLYVNNTQDETIGLHISDRGTISHAANISMVEITTAVETTKITDCKNTHDEILIMANINEMNIPSFKATAITNINMLIRPQTWCNYMETEYYNNVNARVANLNLQVVMKRQAKTIICRRATKTSMGYRINSDFNSGLSICMMRSGTSQAIVAVYTSDNVGWIITEHLLTNQAVTILNLSLQLRTEGPRRLVTSDSDELILALDRDASQYSLIERKWGSTTTVVADHHENYKLLVRSYDNRSHHMFDQKEYFRKATEIVWMGKPMLTNDWDLLEKTYNFAVNRYVYLSGKWYYTIEFSNDRLCRWAERLLSLDLVHTTRSLSNLYYSHPISMNQLETIRENTKKLINKLIPNQPIMEGTFTYQQLDELTNGKLERLIKAKYIESATTYHGESEFTTVIPGWGDYTYVRNDVLPTEHKGKKGFYLPMHDLNFSAANVGGKQVSMIMTPRPESLPFSLPAEADNERPTWRIGDEQVERKGGWWGEFKGNALKPAKQLEAESVKRVKDAIAMMDYQTEASAFCDDIVALESNDAYDDEYEHGFNGYVAPYTENYTGSNLDVLTDFPSAEAIRLWEDTDLTDWLNMYAPENKCKLRGREIPGRIVKTTKITLAKYPIKSRPVLTKAVFEESRSITGRIKSVKHVRDQEKIPLMRNTIANMASIYFVPHYNELLKTFRVEQLVFEPSDIKAWIEASRGAPSVLQEVVKVLGTEILTKPINDVNIHVKMESLLKSSPIALMREQQARIIVWQRKGVCALYTSIFKKAKTRLKQLLREEVVYTDGLRPDEISAFLRTKRVRFFYENDLTKQDRQTDDPILRVEMEIYRILGVNECVLSSWFEMHKEWRFKSRYVKGNSKEMRQTGQATTALGNCITNMQVHAQFFLKNRSSLQFVIFLGDDMLAGFATRPVTKDLRNYIATYFNMQSKESCQSDYGTFCCMIAYPLSDGSCELGPDVVRLKFRYEVTNGAHESTPENRLMRKISYMYMLGGTKEIINILTVNEIGVNIPMWYSFPYMVRGCAEKYEMTEEQVIGYYNNLLDMMCDEQTYFNTFRHYEPANH